MFFAKHSPGKLKKFMVMYNQRIVHCKCLACFETGRCSEAPFSQAYAYACSFVPSWENLLKKYRISFEYKRIGGDLDKYMARLRTNRVPSGYADSAIIQEISVIRASSRCELTPASVQLGEDDMWREVVYGGPITQDDLDLHNANRQKLAMLFRSSPEWPVDAWILEKNARFSMAARMYLHTCPDGAPVRCRVLHSLAQPEAGHAVQVDAARFPR